MGRNLNNLGLKASNGRPTCGYFNVHGRRQDKCTEIRLFLVKTDDSTQSATGTTKDFNKAADEIIDIVDDEPTRRNKRRERH